MASEERCSLDIGGEMYGWGWMDGVGMVWMCSCRCLDTCFRCDVFDCQDVFENMKDVCLVIYFVLVGWRKVGGGR